MMKVSESAMYLFLRRSRTGFYRIGFFFRRNNGWLKDWIDRKGRIIKSSRYNF